MQAAPNSFDRSRFPITASYVNDLPQGIASFPECVIRRDAHEQFLARLAQQDLKAAIPQDVANVVYELRGDEWIPEVVGNAILLMARDRLFDSDAQLLAFARENMLALAGKPLYRGLMRVLSTALVVMGASKRWSTFHRGTELKANVVRATHGRSHATAVLTHPAKLYTALLREQLAIVYSSALELSHAVDGRTEVRQASDTETHFIVSWAS